MHQLSKLSLFFVFLISFSSPIHSALKKNYGHRAGGGDGEYYWYLPENSLSALKASLKGVGGERPLQEHPQFYYLEFDVQETYDQRLVVFHDQDLDRMIPYYGYNLSYLKTLIKSSHFKRRFLGAIPRLLELKISHLTLNELKNLRLYGLKSEKVPTLDEYLEKALEWGLKKPLTLDLKKIRSFSLKRSVIKKLSNFKEKLIHSRKLIFTEEYDLDPSGVTLMGLGRNIKANFGGDLYYWCDFAFRMNLNGIYRAIFHKNYCD